MIFKQQKIRPSCEGRISFRVTTLIPERLPISDTLQRTNIRVSYNVEITSMLIMIQHRTSGMIFIFSVLPDFTNLRLSEKTRRKITLSLQRICFL